MVRTPFQATIQVEVARLHATHCHSNEIRKYSLWFHGTDNNVADAPSRDNDRTDSELTQILHSHCPSQLPQHFKTVPLPNKIVSRLTLLLLRLPVKHQLVETHSTTNLGLEWLLRILPNHWTRRQPLPQRPVPNPPNQNHWRFCRGCASRAIFLTT